MKAANTTTWLQYSRNATQITQINTHTKTHTHMHVVYEDTGPII